MEAPDSPSDIAGTPLRFEDKTGNRRKMRSGVLIDLSECPQIDMRIVSPDDLASCSCSESRSGCPPRCQLTGSLTTIGSDIVKVGWQRNIVGGAADTLRIERIGCGSEQIDGGGLPGNKSCEDGGRGAEKERSKRGTGRYGPSYRMPVGEESAVTAALKRAAKRPGHAVFYPVIGTTFNSSAEAYEFYNLYSWEMGFGIRYGKSKTNSKGYTTRMDLVCSCEGFNKNSSGSSIRTNCKAKLRLLRGRDHSWYVSTLRDTHNHRLSIAYGETRQWRSHKSIDPATLSFVHKMRENNVSVGGICNILGVNEPSSTSCYTSESVRTICAKMAHENLKDDIGKTLALLKDMKKADPSLEVRFKLDGAGCVQTMLWASGINRINYEAFGDVVTFDTTYRTNLYRLPFGLFMGVNNHFQSVVLAGVLFTSEKTSDFEWAFQSFVEVMNNKAPMTMLTDQCAAMAKAMRTTLKDTRHRWCRWHVLKDAKKRLAGQYSKHSKFKGEFNDLVTFETSIVDFERRWKVLVAKYRLTKNKFLSRLFRHREKWAKPYFMSVFCAGMTSTQRSESANHMLKRYIPKAAPMHLFVRKFNELQSGRSYQQGKEEFATHQVQRSLKFNVPIEKHAMDVYTRAMYVRFYDELFEAGSYAVHRNRDNRVFRVVNTVDDGQFEPRLYRVELISDVEIKCECGLYEHMGMLCRHAIKVLVHLDKREIPGKNIHRRWTKSISDEMLNSPRGLAIIENENKVRMKSILSRAMEIADKQRVTNGDAMSNAVQLLESLEGASGSRFEEQQLVGPAGLAGEGCLPTGCPERLIKGGRPESTGLNNWIKKKKREEQSNYVRSRMAMDDWPEEENPPCKKKRAISEL